MLLLTSSDQMQGMSEDEGDKDDTPEVEINEEKAAAARKAREDRNESLRKMMEDDDGRPCPSMLYCYNPLTPSR
jgi:DNA polymerase delta subunit 3